MKEYKELFGVYITMETNYYDSDDKAQRRRVIIITTAIALIVLGIASWAVVAIVSGGQTNTTDTVAVDDASKSANVTEKVADTTAPATEGVSTDGTNTSVKTATTPVSRNTVPETGPEDLLPLALVAGSGAAFIASRKVKRTA